ncbi:MAG: universal stress protein [Ilumatobacteraceae bacterium]
MARILIAVDGTELDHDCVATARHLFGTEAEYLAVSVAEEVARRTTMVPVPYGFVYPYASVEPMVVDDGPDPVARAEDVARRAAEEAGLDNAEVFADIGDPAEVIVDAAGRHACDVIVVGSHGRGWLSRLVQPSVSSEVLSVSSIPVLVVKSPTA